MAYDEHLAERILAALADTPGLTQRKMFGGLCILLRGHMVAGVVGSTLMVRVGPTAYSKLLVEPHARPMDFTGRPLAGMIYVDPPGIATTPQLRRWLERGLAFIATLPAKKAAGTPRLRKPGVERIRKKGRGR